jgi:uncharacterized membrane protein
VAALAAAGFLISAYLAVLKLAGGSALFCEAGTGCDAVQASRYAVFLGVPTAAWGAVAFAVLGGLAVAGFTSGRWLAAFVVAVASVAFTGYLTYLELFVIHAICVWCVTVAVIALLALAVLAAQPPASERRRPGRLAAIGATTAVVTVVVAVGAYVGDGGGRTAYQEGLARHLAATGAIMYGAYW